MKIFYSENNTKIIVGENSKENTNITSSVDPLYWFMHISEYPGPHVIICEKEELSKEVKKDAALLAVYYSNYKKTRLKKYFVDFVRVNHLTLKSNYGSVSLINAQKLSVFFNKEHERLQRLIKSKNDF